MSSLFYIYPSCGRALVIPIITRDTNIVKNTVFEPVLRKDTIFGLTFATRNRKALVPTNMNWGQLQVYHLCPISPLHTEDMWRTQSSPETPILSRILSLNQFYVKIPFLGLLFPYEANKSLLKMHYVLKTTTGLSSLIYIHPLSRIAVVVLIILRDTNIFKNTVFEPVLRKDSVSGLTFDIGTWQTNFPTHFELKILTGL